MVDTSIVPDFNDDPYQIPGFFRHPYTDLTGMVTRLRGRTGIVTCHQGIKLSQGRAAILCATDNNCHDLAPDAAGLLAISVGLSRQLRDDLDQLVAGFGAGGFWLGLAGAAVALWVTFTPCFLWIFTGAPFIDWFASKPRLNSALSFITAAVVGAILNLSIWFSLPVFSPNCTPGALGH